MTNNNKNTKPPSDNERKIRRNSEFEFVPACIEKDNILIIKLADSKRTRKKFMSTVYERCYRSLTIC